jgi:DNA-binding transcriptional ArsR family regulator
MFVDVEDVDEAQYLALMYILNAANRSVWLASLDQMWVELDRVMSPNETDLALSRLWDAGLISIEKDGESVEYRRDLKEAGIFLDYSGFALLLNYPNEFLQKIIDRFGEVPEHLTASLIPFLNLAKVPSIDRYVSTVDAQPQFEALAENLEILKQEIVKDLNLNELPIKQKRAVVAELDGLMAQIRGGFVKLSDLTGRARPLLKEIAEVCKDVTVIAVAATAAMAAIKSILATLF